MICICRCNISSYLHQFIHLLINRYVSLFEHCIIKNLFVTFVEEEVCKAVCDRGPLETLSLPINYQVTHEPMTLEKRSMAALIPMNKSQATAASTTATATKTTTTTRQQQQQEGQQQQTHKQ